MREARAHYIPRHHGDTNLFVLFLFFFSLSLSFLAEPTSFASRGGLVLWLCEASAIPGRPRAFLTHSTPLVTTGPLLGHRLRGAGRELWAAEHVARCGPLVVGLCLETHSATGAWGLQGLESSLGKSSGTFPLTSLNSSLCSPDIRTEFHQKTGHLPFGQRGHEPKDMMLPADGLLSCDFFFISSKNVLLALKSSDLLLERDSGDLTSYPYP